MKIGVVGLGKLGLPLAAVLAKHFNVYGVDINAERVKKILSHEPFFEPKLNEYLLKHGKNLTVSTRYEELKECLVAFIITQTPSLPSGKFDLRYVEDAVKKLHKANRQCLAVISSTINIGDTDRLRQIHPRICYNPEFIKQGSIIHDFENPKFVLVGAYNYEDGVEVLDIWKKVHRKDVGLVEKPVEVEIAKLSLNVSFTLGITFANVIGELARSFNADSENILKLISIDRRFYKPGLGFSGFCFPRDVKCFEAIASERGCDMAKNFAKNLSILNDYVVEKYVAELKATGKRQIGILGVAYKPNVPYVYESQTLKIVQRLAEEGYQIYVYDNSAEETAKKTLNNVHTCVYFCKSLSECVKNCEVLFVGTSNFSKIIVDPWK